MSVIDASYHYPSCSTWSTTTTATTTTTTTKQNKQKKGVKIPTVGHAHLTCRSFARSDESEFLSDLSNAPFDKAYNHTDPDAALATWYSVFLKVLDKHAPQKKEKQILILQTWIADIGNTECNALQRLPS